MKKLEKMSIKRRILQLARLRATGSPAELAYKFEISERSVKRIIREMRNEGEVLKYDYSSMSYIV